MTTPPTGIPRYRPTTAPALFSEGYRPFFLAAAIWSAATLAIWLLVLMGWIELPSAFDPIAWHAHEMIYGFAVAAMAGFLLTAIPNWSGHFPLQGAPLVALISIWLAGRCAMATSALIGTGPAAAIDLAFLLVFLGAVAREVLAGRNWRNVPAVAALSLLLIGSGLTHLDAAGIVDAREMGSRLGLAVLISSISLIGGRIIPSFTRNRLVKQRATRLPVPLGWFDRMTLGLTPIALAAWVVGIAQPAAGILLLAAGLACALRLARWRGIAIWNDPLLLALHLGYAWAALGLVLLGLSGLWAGVPPVAAMHTLGAGAAGTMILAVMIRSTLAHTGRVQAGGPWAAVICLLAQVAALLRVSAAFLPDPNSALLPTSGAAWIMAYSLFAVIYGPHLLRRRSL